MNVASSTLYRNQPRGARGLRPVGPKCPNWAVNGNWEDPVSGTAIREFGRSWSTEVEKLSIALTPEFAADIRQAIATGEYASTSEVVRDALRAWKQIRQERQIAIEELRRLWREGNDSGQGQPLDAEALKHRGPDLDEIWLHVALDNPAAADRLIDRIVARCQGLASHPQLGPARPEIAPDTRALVVGDYLLLYRVDGYDAVIVRVVYGAR
eukprot:gene12820-14759_t